MFGNESERLAVRFMTEAFRTTRAVLWNVVGDSRSSGRISFRKRQGIFVKEAKPNVIAHRQRIYVADLFCTHSVSCPEDGHRNGN